MANAILIKSNSAGVMTAPGEIFNDYENNQALGKYSHAEGSNTIAGLKGYYYSNIDFNERSGIITLTKEQGIEPSEPFTVDWAEGDIISLVSGSKYYDCATITAINNNIITVESLPIDLTEVTWGNDIDDNSIYVIAKPTSGECLLGNYAHVEGDRTQALERASHAEGRQTLAYGQYSHTEGRGTKASYCAHSEGYQSHAKEFYSHAEGMETVAEGIRSHAEGWGSKSIGDSSHAEGNSTKANGTNSHAEGEYTVASGTASHSEGSHTTASAKYSSAKGRNTQATGTGSHAEGDATTAYGIYCHSEGKDTWAAGDYSHCEGFKTQTTGRAAHAEGYNTSADGYYSHAEGLGTKALGAVQHVEGKYNIEDTQSKYTHIIGNGNENNRSNAYTLDWNGNAWYAGSIEGTALILKSPNGTRFKITVSDSGQLNASAL